MLITAWPRVLSRRGTAAPQYLYLLNGEIQEGVLIADTDQALGALAAHAGSQASIELYHNQLVQTISHAVRQAPRCHTLIRLNLWR